MDSVKRLTIGGAAALALLTHVNPGQGQPAEGATESAPPSQGQGSPQTRYIAVMGEAVREASEGRLEEALQKLRQARDIVPDAARTLYLEGSIQRVRGDVAASETPFRACMARAEGRDDALYGRCLVGLALTLEQDQERRPEARELWQRYRQFAATHPEVGAPTLADARIEALDRIQEMTAVGDAVRGRISAREERQ